MRKFLWTLPILIPGLAFAVLFLVPIERWSPGEPGLASGKVAVAIEEGAATKQSWLEREGGERFEAEVASSWREGAKLNLTLSPAGAAREPKVTLILSRGVLDRTLGAAIVHDALGQEQAERGSVRGRIVLDSPTWGVNSPPTGRFDFELVFEGRAVRRLRGAFAKPGT